MKCKFIDDNDYCLNGKNPGNSKASKSTKVGVLRQKCISESKYCVFNGGKVKGYCSYYDGEKCWSKNNPHNKNKGESTYSGVKDQKCRNESENCILNGVKSNGYCGYYDGEYCYSPKNLGNDDKGDYTKVGVSKKKCSNESEVCAFNGGKVKVKGYCSYYDGEKCWSKNDPCNKNKMDKTYSGVENQKCRNESENCILNGVKSNGYCGYYDGEYCYSPKNLGNDDKGDCTKVGVSKKKCSNESEVCAFNGGKVKVKGYCSYYDGEKCWSKNNPCNKNKMDKTYSGVENQKCRNESENCILNGVKSNGYCGYYDGKYCHSPKNLGNRDKGDCTKVGVSEKKCSNESEICAFNGGKVKIKGYCTYFDGNYCFSLKNPLNKYKGEKTTNNVVYEVCSKNSEQCKFNKVKRK